MNVITENCIILKTLKCSYCWIDFVSAV